MNVYDFDGTIYRGDSSIDFFLFCLKRKPVSVFAAVKTAFLFLPYKLHLITKEELKSAFFSFVKYFSAADSLVLDFWAENEKRIEDFYLRQKENSDIIISASPAFLLEPVCKKLGIKLIATEADVKTGRLTGKNCRAQEKLNRLLLESESTKTELKIDSFYSDSLSDLPLAAVSEKSFLVKKGKIHKWLR